MSINISGNFRAECWRTYRLDHVLGLLSSYRHIIDSVLKAQVTHDLLGSIEQLTQIREEAIRPDKKKQKQCNKCTA